MRRRLLWLLALSLPTAAQAVGVYHDTDTLDELRLAYDRSDTAARAAYSRGYVAGVAASEKGSAWCPTGELSDERIYGIVSKYVEEHAANSTQQPAVRVTEALRANFPCASK